LAHFYTNVELKEWIVLFSKLAYLPPEDVITGYTALVEEYEGLLVLQIAKEEDEPKVTGRIASISKYANSIM
jgi:hypothetical protein